MRENSYESLYAAVGDLRQYQQTIVESGHVYLHPQYLEREDHEMITEEELQGVKVGLLVQQLLLEAGVSVQTMLFVDDLHGNRGNEAETEIKRQDVLAHFNSIGFSPDQVVYEQALMTSAAHLYGRLVQKGVIKSGDRYLPEQYGSIQLYTEVDKLPTCALIDAALYLKKMGPARDRATITVLPDHYLKQQDQVRYILGAVGESSLAVAVLYVAENGEPSKYDSWKNKAQ